MKEILSLFALVLGLSVASASDTNHETISAKGHKPLVLIARLNSLPGKSSAVIALSAAADKAVEEKEPGMLLHTFDRNPSDKLGFVWTEVYANSAALEFHLQNPDLIKYLTDVNPLLASFTVELYGEVSQAAVDMLEATGTPTTHYKTELGFIRDLTCN